MTPSEYHALIDPYINRKVSRCSYCARLEPLILLKGKHIYVTIAIGSFVEGYLQICANKHRTGATGLTLEEQEEFELMKQIVFETYKAIYGVHGIAFEHGQAGSCLWTKDEYINNVSSWCHHMHTHCVPVSINVHNRIIARFPEFYEVSCVKDMIKVRTKILHSKPYLFFQPESGNGYMYNVEGIKVPSQFLRTCVAKELGIPEMADWAQYPGIEHYNKTKEKLQPILRHIYDEKA